MKEVFVKRKMPESPQDCSDTNCNDCVFDCNNHAECKIIWK